MKCSSLFGLVVVVVAASACVQSSGFQEPPTTENVVAIDGAKPQPWKAVHVEIPKDGKPYADGRIARVSGIFGELTVFVELGEFGPDAQTIEPFGAVNVSATDGSDSKTSYEALSGTVTVKSGDGSPTGSLSIDLAGVDLVDVCTGAHKKIDSANMSGAAEDLVLSTPELGVAGFVFSSEVKTSFYDPFPYVGIVEGTTFTNNHGVAMFEAGSGEQCSLQNPRPGHHLFTARIDPAEVNANGGVIDFSKNPVSFFFVGEFDANNNLVRNALATAGTFTIDNGIELSDGSVLQGTLANLSLSYVNASATGFTTDPPMTIASMKLKAVYGKPVVP